MGFEPQWNRQWGGRPRVCRSQVHRQMNYLNGRLDAPRFLLFKSGVTDLGHANTYVETRSLKFDIWQEDIRECVCIATASLLGPPCLESLPHPASFSWRTKSTVPTMADPDEIATKGSLTETYQSTLNSSYGRFLIV